MEKKKVKKHIICNLLLFIAFISIITNFIVTIIFNNNSNFIIDLVSNLLLCIFIIFYIFSQITNHKTNKSTTVLASLFLIIYSLFQIATKLNYTNMLKLNEVLDFKDQNLIEVIKWSEKNQVKLNQIYEYSDNVEEYHIISQNQKEGTPIKNIKSLDIVISEGPNPYKEVIVPDMTNWKANKVLKLIKKDLLSNIIVDFQISDKDKDTVIEQSKSGNMARNEELKLVFSLGEEDSLEETKLISLKNKSEFEAVFFLKQHSLKYDLKRDFSNTIKRDYVSKQSINPGTIIQPNDDKNKVILTISKGKEIKVPNLKDYSVIQITNWAIKNKLRLEFNHKYDDTIKEKKIIDVNYSKGDIIEQKTLIKITVSKGKLTMPSFNNLDEFKSWANKNKISYEEKYEFSNDIPSGKVISYSHKKGDLVKNGDTIVVTVSQGQKIKIPNLVGKTKEEAIKKLKSINIKYNFIYEYSNKDKNTVIKQSLSEGSEVSENTTITLTVSSGKEKTNNKTNTNSTPHKSEDTTPSCDKTRTIHVYLTAGATGTETKNNIQKAYPNIKWVFQMVDQCSNGSKAKGTICNSSKVDDVDLNYCDSYTVVIVN